jgi:polysaccharide biosynthesis transport protein
MDPLKATQQPEAKLHFLDYWRIIRIRKTVIMAVFFLVVLTATVVTYILPETYRSTAQIQVEQNHSDIPSMNEQTSQRPIDILFIQTELGVLRSQAILHRVISNLDLTTKWGKRYFGGQKPKVTEIYPLLYRQVDPQPSVRNTSLIDINVVSDDRQEAADIANEIANVYRDYRLEKLKENALRGIKTLEEHAKEHEKIVRAAQAELDKLRIDLAINEEEAGSTGPSRMQEQKLLDRIDQLRLESERDYVRESDLLSKLTNYPPAQLREVLPTATHDDLLQQFLGDLSIAENQLAMLQKQYGGEHPEVKRALESVAVQNKKIDERVNGILEGIKTRVSAYEATFNSIALKLETAKKVDQARASATQPYWNKKRELEDLLRQRQMLHIKIFTEMADQKLPTERLVTVLGKAEAPNKAYRPNKTVNIALGIVLGLIVGVGLAFFIEYLDTSVKTIDDVERALQAPVLGVIPQNVGILLEEGVESPHAEAYRVLRTNILFTRKDEKLNSICVVSAGAGEGKSTTVFNLATIFAQAGQRVVVVDSDLRRPTLHKMLEVTNAIGITNYLLKQNTLAEVIQTTSLPSLDFIPSGKLPSTSMGILNSVKMRELITELKSHYDFVFFDSPPIMGVSDASVLASEVDMTLQVIQYRRYPQSMNVRAKQMIEKVGGNLVGIVLNNINVSQDENYYYYSGYYHDYYSQSDDEETVNGAANGRKKISREIKPKA